MIVALVFAHVWGVIQLIVLGSLARTVRARTVLMALAVGLYVCAPLAVLLQMAWIRPAAWLTDVPVYAMATTAGYTANPFIEEAVKVLPIAALLLIPTMRRQWSLTDCVLTGAAAGSGFGLAESLFRYGAAAQRANSIDQGWVLTTNLSFPVVPSVWSTLNSWLPEAGVPWDQIPVSGRFPPNVHLVWSALGGLAVGLIMLRRGWRWRTLAGVLLVYVAVDHTAWNAAIRSQEFIGRAAIEQLRTFLWLAPILALALAWWLDRQRQHADRNDEVSLAAEQSASPRLVGTVRAAISRLPWSLTQVYGFVRMRRAHNSERTSPISRPKDLSATLVHLRDRIDRQLGDDRSSPLPSPGRSGALRVALCRPSVITWLLLMVPSVMWFVIGGLPQTAALQARMTAPVAWKAIVALSVIAQAWLAWRVVHGLRALPMLLRLPSGDDAALFALRVACGVGAIGLGGHALMRAFSGVSPNSSLLNLFNGTEAYASGTPATELQLANGAGGVVPPGEPVPQPVINATEEGIRRAERDHAKQIAGQAADVSIKVGVAVGGAGVLAGVVILGTAVVTGGLSMAGSGTAIAIAASGLAITYAGAKLRDYQHDPARHDFTAVAIVVPLTFTVDRSRTPIEAVFWEFAHQNAALAAAIPILIVSSERHEGVCEKLKQSLRPEAADELYRWEFAQRDAVSRNAYCCKQIVDLILEVGNNAESAWQAMRHELQPTAQQLDASSRRATVDRLLQGALLEFRKAFHLSDVETRELEGLAAEIDETLNESSVPAGELIGEPWRQSMRLLSGQLNRLSVAFGDGGVPDAR